MENVEGQIGQEVNAMADVDQQNVHHESACMIVSNYCMQTDRQHIGLLIFLYHLESMRPDNMDRMKLDTTEDLGPAAALLDDLPWYSSHDTDHHNAWKAFKQYCHDLFHAFPRQLEYIHARCLFEHTRLRSPDQINDLLKSFRNPDIYFPLDKRRNMGLGSYVKELRLGFLVEKKVNGGE